jgi:HAD superfamily hydrolase (TIGR01509 family)
MSLCGGGALGGVLWDMDGTLIDSRTLWEVAYREFVEQRGITFTPELWEQIAGQTLEVSVATLCAHVGLATNRSAVERACSWLATRVLQRLVDQPALLQWRPGARQALQAVQHAEIPTALVTTTWRSLTDGITAVLGVRFDATVCGDEVIRGKPAPDSYLRAVTLLDVCPGCCVAVEDSAAGVAAAEAAAIAVLVVPSHIAINPGVRRTVRSSLTGLTVAELSAVAASASASRPYGGHQALRAVGHPPARVPHW